MSENVKIADDGVAKMRTMLTAAEGKRLVPIQTQDLIEFLHQLERLAILERHLYNLCSNGYKQYAQ